MRIALVALLVLITSHCATAPSTQPLTIYENAMTWDGTDFRVASFAVSNGKFVRVPKRRQINTTVVDLSGQWVIPGLGNAHHHITNASDATSNAFLAEGIYYAWNPTNLATSASEESRQYFARGDTYDVKQSLGGITEPGGHPEKLYVDILAKWVYKGKEKSYFVGNAFHYGRSPSEIEAALNLLVDQGADFVKIYLLHSEEYSTRRDDDEYYGNKGLNPDNIAMLVSAAHKRKLFVAAHIETTADFRVAVAAGVDVLAHLPGYSSEKTLEGYETKRLERSDALAAARAGVAVIPTYYLARARYDRMENENMVVDPALKQAHYDLQAHNLQLLHDASVTILAGTDADIGIQNEIEHWSRIGGLSSDAAFKVALDTAAYLFPERRIGRIAAGFEADFIALTADPRQAFRPVEQASMRVKAGQILQIPQPDNTNANSD